MSTTKAPLWVAFFIGFALPVFAQTDWSAFTAELRARYGPPLARETFTVRPGIEMVVDYAANGHVCRIQLPPIGPEPRSQVSSGNAIDDLLNELVPLSVRGAEQQRMRVITGLPSTNIIEYRNLTVSETFQGASRTGVAVTFTNEICQDRPPR
jgi:hypothetical protein